MPRFAAVSPTPEAQLPNATYTPSTMQGPPSLFSAMSAWAKKARLTIAKPAPPPPVQAKQMPELPGQKKAPEMNSSLQKQAAAMPRGGLSAA